MRKTIVTGINARTGGGFKTQFKENEYSDHIKNTIANYIEDGYVVVCTETTYDENDNIDYQVVINIHPKSINCPCGKGIYCPFNMQQVNYFRGQVNEVK